MAWMLYSSGVVTAAAVGYCQDLVIYLCNFYTKVLLQTQHI